MRRDEAIKAMLVGIRDAQSIADQDARRVTWERCWDKNDHQPYFGSQNFCRVNDGFLEEPGEEFRLFSEQRRALFAKYLKGVTEVSEFGCGTGDNLMAIGGRRTLRGFDWSQSAVDKCRDKGIDAQVFDMFHPDYAVKLSGAVFTIHALEQLGANFRPFLNYLIEQRPKICFHIEPIVELYDETNLLDFLAAAYHRKRGYLEGFLPCLHDLAAVRKIELLEVRKSTFGNIHHMAYSVIVWRPL